MFKGKAADIWSLGVTLYCLLHGHCPFEDLNIIALYEKILHDPVVLDESISSHAQDLIMKMLQRDPNDRIKLSEIKIHPWVTRDGLDPCLSTEENCVLEQVTKEEVDNAFSPVVKFVSGLLKKLKKSIKQPNSNGTLPFLPRSNTSPSQILASSMQSLPRKSNRKQSSISQKLKIINSREMEESNTPTSEETELKSQIFPFLSIDPFIVSSARTGPSIDRLHFSAVIFKEDAGRPIALGRKESMTSEKPPLFKTPSNHSDTDQSVLAHTKSFRAPSHSQSFLSENKKPSMIMIPENRVME